MCAVQALEKGPTDYFATRACKLLGCYQLQLGNEHEDSEGSQGCGEEIRLRTCSRGAYGLRAEREGVWPIGNIKIHVGRKS